MTDSQPDSADRAALARDLVEAAYLEGDFILSSGQHSRFYFDKYLFETRPELLRRVARHLAALIPAGTQRLCGPELGGVALATAVSLETGLPFVISRRASKDYSTGKTIEGVLEPGERVVVVEDVITSGAQAIKAAQRMVEAGATVLGILAVIDRLQGGGDAIAAAGFTLTPLFDRTQLGV
jgi:orotate phosphoribosyltransferase